MSENEFYKPLPERWPLEDTTITEVLEMAQALRTLDDFESFKLRHPDVYFGQISVRNLCSLYLEDMHNRAGLPLDYEHY